MPVAGLFVTFEGPDGGGKSTQQAILSDYLCGRGFATLCTREPGGTPLADGIRQLLLDPAYQGMCPVAEALLYAASRAQHVQEVIRPALTQGKIILCDRFLDSSLAYQSFGRGLPEALVRGINEDAVDGFIPDLTFLLDIDPTAGLARVADSRGEAGLDRLEQEASSFHRLVREGFLALATEFPERIHLIDAALPAEEVAGQIRQRVEEKLASRGKQGLTAHNAELGTENKHLTIKDE